MNGAPLGDKFKRCSTYVAQEDVFVPTLSAWETLHFHAILRLPKGTSKADIKRRMDDVMEVMGLSRVRTTQVTHRLISRSLTAGYLSFCAACSACQSSLC